MMNGGASLTQIGIGVFVSAVFSSLLEPAYRATVSDILTEDEFSKASGLVSIAGSARFLISPLLAGILLSVADVKVLLIIDILTFVFTVITTGIVRKEIVTKQTQKQESFMQSLKEGFRAVCEKKGVFTLILVSSVLTCFMGTLQILAEPLILDFSNSTILGIGETICATGMLVSSIFLGVRGIKKNYVKTLAVSLIGAGIAMTLFGIKENIYVICTFGFLFFAMLPFANNCLDYLVRTNIDKDLLGRAWGVIGFLSQIGYVVAYALAGNLADITAHQMNIGVGRGAAVVVMGAGVLLALTAIPILFLKSVRKLEH